MEFYIYKLFLNELTYRNQEQTSPSYLQEVLPSIAPYISKLKTLLSSDGYLNIISKYILIEKSSTFYMKLFLYFPCLSVYTGRCWSFVILTLWGRNLDLMNMCGD